MIIILQYFAIGLTGLLAGTTLMDLICGSASVAYADPLISAPVLISLSILLLAISYAAKSVSGTVRSWRNEVRNQNYQQDDYYQ